LLAINARDRIITLKITPERILKAALLPECVDSFFGPELLNSSPLLLILLFLLPHSLQAWGPLGHSAIAAVAEKHLSPSAQSHVNELLAAVGKAGEINRTAHPLYYSLEIIITVWH
jgi:hypothetical protein